MPPRFLSPLILLTRFDSQIPVGSTLCLAESRRRDQFGCTALMGLNFLILRKKTVGAYGEYVVPDWRRTQGYWEYGFNFSGLSL